MKRIILYLMAAAMLTTGASAVWNGTTPSHPSYDNDLAHSSGFEQWVANGNIGDENDYLADIKGTPYDDSQVIANKQAIDSATAAFPSFVQQAKDYVNAGDAQTLTDANAYADANDNDTIYDDTGVKSDIVTNTSSIGTKETIVKSEADDAMTLAAAKIHSDANDSAQNTNINTNRNSISNIRSDLAETDAQVDKNTAGLKKLESGLRAFGAMSALDLEQGEIGVGGSYYNGGSGIAIGFAVPLGTSTTFSLKAGADIKDFDNLAIGASLKYKF